MNVNHTQIYQSQRECVYKIYVYKYKKVFTPEQLASELQIFPLPLHHSVCISLKGLSLGTIIKGRKRILGTSKAH